MTLLAASCRLVMSGVGSNPDIILSVYLISNVIMASWRRLDLRLLDWAIFSSCGMTLRDSRVSKAHINGDNLIHPSIE